MNSMNLWARLRAWWRREELPPHLRRGRLGEKAAKRQLRRLGMKFLVANFRSARGEIDLVFRDRDCLVFIEVKTRVSETWGRPASAVDAERTAPPDPSGPRLPTPPQEPAGESPLRHRRGLARRRASAGDPAPAQHLRHGAAVSVWVGSAHTSNADQSMKRCRMHRPAKAMNRVTGQWFKNHTMAKLSKSFGSGAEAELSGAADSSGSDNRPNNPLDATSQRNNPP